MANYLKTGTTSQAVTTKGDFKVGVIGSSDYGPTSSTGFYKGITPPVGGYTIYVAKASQGPSIHVAYDDAQAIFFLKSFGATGSTISQVLAWSNAQTNIWTTSANLTSSDLSTIVTSGLTLHLDAGNPSSYPGTGTTWTSLTGAYSGTMGAGVTYSSSDGGALVFNGASNAFVNMYSTASALSSATNNISIEAWYKSNNNQPGILRTGLSSSGFVLGYYVGTGTSWKVTKYGVIDISTGTIPQNTAWHHVVLTYSSTTGTRIYIDGTLSGTASANTTNISAGSEFSIGKSESVFHNGNIAIFRWYSSVLSSADVLQNFNANKTRFGL